MANDNGVMSLLAATQSPRAVLTSFGNSIAVVRQKRRDISILRIRRSRRICGVAGEHEKFTGMK
jgi:hypothetical protein